jgi:hypothetical protein
MYYIVYVGNEEMKMKTFKFTAYGETFTAKATRGLDVMEQANKTLLWTPKFKSGCWFDTSETEFRWVEGNFFD